MRCLNCNRDGIPTQVEVCPQCEVHLPTLLRDVLPPGTLLRGGTYRIDYALGWGGFGITYRAAHLALEQTVAIKEFFPRDHVMRSGPTSQVATRPDSRQDYGRSLKRFMREGRVLARLSHQNVIRVQDLFEERGTGYLVMDLITPARSLRAELDVRAGGRLEPERVREIITQLVSALSAVHGQGVCHLDIKPDNVLLDKHGRAVLIDFGASRQGLGTCTTQAFTLDYAAPEVLAGEEVGPESDLFELGMLTHEMLTGRRPPSALNRLTGAKWEPDGLEEPWRKLIASALRLRRDERPAPVAKWWQEGREPEPPPPSPTPTPPPTAERTRVCARCRGRVSIVRGRCLECGAPATGEVVVADAVAVHRISPAMPKNGGAVVAPNGAGKNGVTPNGAVHEVKPSQAKKAGKGWKVLAVFTTLSTVAMVAVLLIVLAAFGAEINNLKGLDTQLAQERSKRNKLAETHPMVVTQVRLYNQDKDGKMLGTYATSFTSSQARYICWEATLLHLRAGEQSLGGDLYVKYIRPDGSLDYGKDSPTGYTLKHGFNVSDSATVNSGWGRDSGGAFTPGKWRIQIWYEGKILHETEFKVS